MGKRIAFDIVGIALVFLAPWWATLIYGIIGALVFSWYVEIILFGILYDAIYGATGGTWYRHLMHTGIFTIPVVVIQFIKSKTRW